MEKEVYFTNKQNHIKISVWFDVQSELGGGEELLYIRMEIVNF